MPLQHLCAECLAAGVQAEQGFTTDYLVCCAFCGKVDEAATISRNTVDETAQFGSLMNEHGVSSVQFDEYREKRHEDFVNRLLEAYLVDPRSRIVEKAADHFKAGARHWYNRMRNFEMSQRKLKHATTSNTAKKVKYRLAVAIQFAIQESNILVVNNRLSHIKPLAEASTSTVARGDGTIMTPTPEFIFERASALDPNNFAYLDSWDLLRWTQKTFSKELRSKVPPVDVALSQMIVLMSRIQHLTKLSDTERIKCLRIHDFTAAASRRGVTPESAHPTDYQLSPDVWDFLAEMDWDKVLVMAYNIFCAQQVVCLWGSRSSINVSTTLLLLCVEAYMKTNLPGLTALTRELCIPYGGSEHNALRRRTELKDFLVGWSSSFPAARLPIPIIPAPKKGTVGDGLKGYGSDKRRAIPETVMAIAAAPVIAQHWRLIMRTRLATRKTVVSVDREFAMAARMFARAYEHDVKMKKLTAKAAKQRAARKTASTPSSRLQSPASPTIQSFRAVSQPPGSLPLTPRSSTPSRRAGMSREDMLRMMDVPDQQKVQDVQEASIEQLLATREDSSDEEIGASDDESLRSSLKRTGAPWHPEDTETASSAPFGFSVGPDGFSVARTEPSRTENAHLKRPLPVPAEQLSPAKRPRRGPQAVPMSPPTSVSSREPSPALKPTVVFKDGQAMAIATRSSVPPSASISLRSVSMSPTPSVATTLMPVEESDQTKHIGVLLREREQYVWFNKEAERRKGLVVSKEIEAEMNRWVAKLQRAGELPAKFDRTYLASIGFDGDPLQSDLGVFIESSKDEWSPTETLLRLGIRPDQFPVHYVVHSLTELKRQLDRAPLDADLAPEGMAIDSAELDDELDVLFQTKGERISDIVCTPTEVEQRRKMYERLWAESEGRNLHAAQRQIEAREGLNPPSPPRTSGPPKTGGSRRIDMAVLRKLCFESDEEDEDVADAVRDVVAGDGLFGVSGSAGISGYDEDGDGDEDE